MRLLGITAILLLAARPLAAETVPSCLDAAAAAERSRGVPENLVAAVGRVESGQRDPLTGQVAPWPWTVNADGVGHYFASRDAAVAFVRDAQAHGARFIDVGCFQIDLFYHPAAFASLEEAFDPAANADYAAQFLATLHDRTASWPDAVARYHSGQLLEGELYRERVMAAENGSVRLPDADPRPGPRPGIGAIRIGRATGGAAGRDPYVVLMSAAARSVRVIGP